MINEGLNTLFTIASRKGWKWVGENKNVDTIVSHYPIKIDDDGYLAHLDGSKDFHPKDSQWIFTLTIGRKFTINLEEL